eukprot:860209-Amphidinium_carterae.1
MAVWKRHLKEVWEGGLKLQWRHPWSCLSHDSAAALQHQEGAVQSASCYLARAKIQSAWSAHLKGRLRCSRRDYAAKMWRARVVGSPHYHSPAAWRPKEFAECRVFSSRQYVHNWLPLKAPLSGVQPRRGSTGARRQRVTCFGVIADSLTVIIGAAVVVSFGFVLWALPALGSQEQRPPRSVSEEG